MIVRSRSRGVSIVAVCTLLVSYACDTAGEAPDALRAQAPAAPPAEPKAQAPVERRRPAAEGTVAYEGELPPLPVANFPTPRPPEMIRAVYEFAARRPDVLRYVPCFCGCERNGHVHNEHCFIAGRAADGKPRWDAHGMG